MLLTIAVGQTGAAAEGAGAQWVRDALVIVSTGKDALGGRVPGSWFAHDRAQIATSREHAFTGASSLKIELKHGAGGCQRIVTAPGGKFRMVFSCRIFVPKGQSFKKMPSVHIWRGANDVVAQAEPITRSGEWVESVLEMDRPTGQLFYFGVSAEPADETQPVYYVDHFILENRAESLNWLANPDFEQDAGDKRPRLLADFNPDLLTVWMASDLNKDGLLHRHGVRVASWGKVEYDACIDWDKRLDELKKTSAKRDIEGQPEIVESQPPFKNRMCHHSPVWHDYQKSGLLRIINDNDALGQDNLCNPTFRGGKDSCYCEHCQRDFRKHLERNFTKEQLKRLLPCPVGEFSIAAHIKRIRPTHPAFKLLDDPIAREFVRAQYIAGKSFIADIAASIRDKATEQNRVVPFFGNQGAAWGGNRFPVFSVIISDVVDTQCLEDFLLEPYNRTSRTAWSVLQYKLMRALSFGRKPVWPLLDTGKFRKWATGARLFPARALSQGAVPLLMWSPMAWPDEATYQAHANYARFLNANRALFLNRKPVARVALVYSVPTCFWRYFNTYWIYWRAGSNHGKWIGQVARVLEDAHIPYKPVVFGHPDLLDDEEQLASLDRYDMLVLTDVDCVSDRQAEAVRRFKKRGGRVVVIGDFGSRNENFIPREEPLMASELPVTVVSDFRDLKTSPEKVHAARTALCEAIQRPQPIIETDAPPTLNMAFWRDAGGRRLCLHMVNSNVDLKRHGFRPATSVEISLRLPERFDFNRIRLISPDTPPSDLAFKRQGETVSFRVPSVRCYAIVVLTTDNELTAANLIATAHRNLDRAHVAGRGKPASQGDARDPLAEAERLYEARRYADAEEKARAAVQASAATLEQRNEQ
jgi:hypothetical protein